MDPIQVILGLIFAFIVCKKFVFPFLDKIEKKGVIKHESKKN